MAITFRIVMSPRAVGSACCWSLLLLTVAHSRGQWVQQQSGSESRLRGVCAVDDRLCWATGAGGTILRTTDGGASWKKLVAPGGGGLDFRDVHAFHDRTAYVLSIGYGELSRIYKTSDAGASWTASFQNQNPRDFLDAIAFWDERDGIAQGDALDGRFMLLTTADGGSSWRPVPSSNMPRALDNEGAFAASGTCLVVQGDHHAWFATGGAKRGRVFRTTDRGQTWNVSETPINATPAWAGIFSLAFRDPLHGVAVGGDYKRPAEGGRIIARTEDGGRTWKVPRGPGPRAYRSAVAYLPAASTFTVIAVGPSGADISTDDGETWQALPGPGFHAISFAPSGRGWAVGENGLICRYENALALRE